MSAFGFVFSVSIDLFITKVKTSSHSGKKFPQPSNLGLSELIAFSLREPLRKWGYLQMEASAAECFPQLLPLPQLWDRTKCNCPGKKSTSLFSSWRGEAGNSPEHHCMIPWFPLGRCGHCECLLGPWVGAEMGRERKKKNSWIICTRNYVASTCGFVNFWCCPGWVTSLLSVSFCILIKISKNDRTSR